MLSDSLPPFALKRFLMGPEARTAKHSLGSSYCEPLVVEELLALDEEGAATLQEAKLGYPGFRGSTPLREAVAGLYDGLAADEINLYAGGDDSILAFATACLKPGDHVIVQVPTYQSLYSLPQAIGCRVDLLTAQEKDGWSLDLNALADLIAPNTKAIMLNQPQNPTGALLPKADFAAIFELAERHGTLVFVDEIYRRLERDPETTLPAACELSPLGVSLGAMSKIFGLPGLRLGWLATRNREVLDALAALRDYHNSTVSAPSELLARIAIRHRAEIWSRHRQVIADNLARLDDFMARRGNIMTWQRPPGGTIAFPCLAEGLSSARICAKLLSEHGILLPASRYFDHGDRHVRVGYGTRDLARALAALDDVLEEVVASAGAPAG
ncbi:MAG: aminotransferase class I/II-fold pyridoxal phosphate-dependent enzyme [Pseudomonadota bacterium]